MATDQFPVARLWSVAVAKRRLLAAVLLVCAGLGAVGGALRPKWYAAEVTLVLRRTAALDESTQRPDAADYPTLLANRAVAAELVKTHDLARWDIDARRLLELVNIREVRNTSLLLMSVALPDPQVAQAVANAFARKALDLNRELNAGDLVRARDHIKQQYDEAVVRLGQAETALLDFRSTAMVELRRADSKAKLDAREELITLSAELEAERSRLETLQGQLKRLPQTTEAPRSPAAEQELAEQARQFDATGDWDRPPVEELAAAGVRQREPLSKDVPNWPRSSTTTNPVRQLVEYQVSASTARVSAMAGRLRDLSTKHDVDNKAIPELLALYQGEVRLTRLELEREIAAKAVADLASQYERARLNVAGRVTNLQIVDEAMAPTRPTTSGIAVAAVIGLLVGAVICLGILAQALLRAREASDVPAS